MSSSKRSILVSRLMLVTVRLVFQGGTSLWKEAMSCMENGGVVMYSSVTSSGISYASLLSMEQASSYCNTVWLAIPTIFSACVNSISVVRILCA